MDEFKAKGNEFFKAKSYDQAIQWYTKAIDCDPNAEAAGAVYSNRAASYQGLAKFQDAVNDAEACIRVRPDWLKGHFRKGVAMESMNNVDQALKAFEAALRTEPKNEEVQEKVSTLRARIKDRNDKTQPQHLRSADDAKLLGNSLFGEGKYERASAFYGRALEVGTSLSADEKATLYANRAACRQQTHDFEGVIADANAALEVVPNHVKALLRRAIAYEGIEKWQKALDDYNAVNRTSPGMANVSQGIVRCQRALRG